MSGRKKRSPPPSFATVRGTWNGNPYVPLFGDQLDSPAYLALSANAKEVYTMLRQEYKGPFTGSKVICPYDTFIKKGMRPNTVSRALLMLEVFGFIKVDHGGLEHQPNVYHFSEGWKMIKTEDDVKARKAEFKDLLSRKKAIKEAKEETEVDGIYIRSNESVSYESENKEEIDNESVSKTDMMERTWVTNALAAQLTKPLAENERGETR